MQSTGAPRSGHLRLPPRTTTALRHGTVMVTHAHAHAHRERDRERDAETDKQTRQTRNSAPRAGQTGNMARSIVPGAEVEVELQLFC